MRPGSLAGLDPAVRRVLAAQGLVLAYVLACAVPALAAGLWGGGGSAATRISIALGFAGLEMLVLQFVLVSRSRWLIAALGIRVPRRAHVLLAFVALGFVLLHPLLLLADDWALYAPLLWLPSAPWRVLLALASILCLLCLIATTPARRLRLSPRLWRAAHGALATAAAATAVGHAVGAVRHASDTVSQPLVLLSALGFSLVLGWAWLARPVLRRRRPWRVVSVGWERGHAATLHLEPAGHPGIAFRPGQFAWMRLAPPSVAAGAELPLSFSSPALGDGLGSLTVTVRAAGSRSRLVASVRPGALAYLDGPFGSFSIDARPAPGYVFIGGGVGITPLFSMLATLHVRQDRRPLTLFYASQDWEQVIFREELDHLSARMDNLTVVHLLKHPHPGWSGRTTPLRAGMVATHLPPEHLRFVHFVCGSPTLVRSARAVLADLGVPAHLIVIEGFTEG
jgi:predicted ferric reductase